MRLAVPAFIFCLIVCCRLGAEVKTYAVPGHDSLQLDIPADWRDTFFESGALSSRYPSVRLAPRKSDTFEAHITIIPNNEDNKDFSSPEKIKQRAEVTGKHIIDSGATKESKLDLHEIKSG